MSLFLSEVVTDSNHFFIRRGLLSAPEKWKHHFQQQNPTYLSQKPSRLVHILIVWWGRQAFFLFMFSKFICHKKADLSKNEISHYKNFKGNISISSAQLAAA